MFTPIPGEMIQFDDCAYFSIGWVVKNHQLVTWNKDFALGIDFLNRKKQHRTQNIDMLQGGPLPTINGVIAQKNGLMYTGS